MNLAFLYPLAFLSALAIAVPLWLHLQRRFQGQTVPFSTLRFLHDEPLARRAPLRLKNPLLFALRVLAVLLVATAFAWPYDRSDVPVSSIESRVYLLDNTLSHQAGDQFKMHRDRLADDIANQRRETQVAVVELTTQPRVLVPFGQDPVAAAEVVRARDASFERGSYAAALRLADTLLRSSIGDRRRLLIYGDHQSNQYAELRESPPLLEDVEVEAVEGSDDPRTNCALARPQLRRLLAGDRSILELTLELYHQGEVDEAPLKVISNGRPVFDRSLRLAGEPERIVLTMRWEEARGVGVQGVAMIESPRDALAGDNQAHFTVPPVRRGRVALLAQSIYLQAAFAPNVMQEAWDAKPIEPNEALAAARRGDMAEILCLESHYLVESSAAKVLLHHYLNSDRGVFLILDDHATEVTNVLDELGFELDEELSIAKEPRAAGFVQRDHPIFQPFRAPDFGSLAGVHFTRHYTVRSSQATPLLFSDGGDPLLYELSGQRRLLLTAFPLVRDATDWPLHPTFVPFLDLCLQSLRREVAAPTSLLPRELSVFHLPADSQARQFVVLDGTRELERGTVDRRRVQFTAPAKPGVYLVNFDSTSETPLWLAVNPSPQESELHYMDPDEIVPGMVRQETNREPAPLAMHAPTRMEILQQRIWWGILLLALLAFIGENLWITLRAPASSRPR